MEKEVTILDTEGEKIYSFSCEDNTIERTVAAARRAGVSLKRANLSYADLRYVDLAEEDLSYADLSYTDLRFANLQSASLNNVYMVGADVRYTNMSHATVNNSDMRSVHLAYANWMCITVQDTNLLGSSLINTDITGAHIQNTNIDGELVRHAPVIRHLRWHVIITDNYMRIGCQRHMHKQWENFSEIEISAMDSRASKFWKAHKDDLLTLCKIQAVR